MQRHRLLFATLFTASALVTQACLDDMMVCRSGQILYRDPDLGCDFAMCVDIDAQVTDESCDLDAFTCENGDIVYRDIAIECAFAPCPSTLPSSSQPSTSPGTTDSSSKASRHCPRDAFVCPGGFFVRRNPALACAFDACPVVPKGKTCPSDSLQCPSGERVHRNSHKHCFLDSCPS